MEGVMRGLAGTKGSAQEEKNSRGGGNTSENEPKATQGTSIKGRKRETGWGLQGGKKGSGWKRNRIVGVLEKGLRGGKNAEGGPSQQETIRSSLKGFFSPATTLATAGVGGGQKNGKSLSKTGLEEMREAVKANQKTRLGWFDLEIEKKKKGGERRDATQQAKKKKNRGEEDYRCVRRSIKKQGGSHR